MSLQQPPRKPPVVNCPSCGQPVRWEPASAWRPFCSERCRVQDLGAWATGEYRIPVVEEDAGEDGSGLA